MSQFVAKRQTFRLLTLFATVFMIAATATAAYAVPQLGNSNVPAWNCGSGTATRGDSQYWANQSGQMQAHARTVPNGNTTCNSFRATMTIHNVCAVVDSKYQLYASTSWASATFSGTWTNATANHATTASGNGALLKRQPYYSAASFESSTGLFHASESWFLYGKASGTCP